MISPNRGGRTTVFAVIVGRVLEASCEDPDRFIPISAHLPSLQSARESRDGAGSWSLETLIGYFCGAAIASMEAAVSGIS